MNNYKNGGLWKLIAQGMKKRRQGEGAKKNKHIKL
jgi:hypothetical protein